ncbi:endonuclease Q family protein [Lederbergia sp. NSJ-179]|uniref:endonuclease Q family protein n=1 Tax=Lederbergia sp. NSJ-179 TaxID=2931402 RepID=UPI001FCFC391|nr:endonuclease Q family protein [Lederbergia sp. NSJ-179]MCJ7839397.1 endonuclease Q family protein [Lederbergia sp. NSJ-179]
MSEAFADLHIHIGRTYTGKAVKITGSKTLTLSNILKAAKYPKGLDIVGVIDCHSPGVIIEIEQLIEAGKLVEMDEGGFRFEDEVTLIPGTEIEVYDENCHGPIHVLAFFPTFPTLKDFSNWLSKRVTNIQLSTQRIYEKAEVLQEKVKSLDGLFIPAHIFTPFKSLYGKGVVKSLTEILNPHLIDAVELGLSSDTEMANQISELHSYTFLTNSDAHSTQKIAREYQKFELEAPTFDALSKALVNQDGNTVRANYGLNPRLGKYYRTTCAVCSQPMKTTICSHCGAEKYIKGVSERISELADAKDKPQRPPYIHQVPLDFIPGLGPKTMQHLLDHFGTEMNILHRVDGNDLKKVVNVQLAEMIIQAREGNLQIAAGGGGKYGRIEKKAD